MVEDAESEVTTLARRLAAAGTRRHAALLRSSWWNELLLEWAMSHPSFRTELFRFVDVLPATTGSADVMSHLSEYLAGSGAPRVLDLGLELAAHLPLGAQTAAALARRSVGRIAQQFIAGRDPREAIPRLRRLWQRGSAFTVDLLGERTVSELEADRYAARVSELVAELAALTPSWPPDPRLERDDLGPLPRVNVSLKPTALASQFQPLAADLGLEQAGRRLATLATQARGAGALLHLDLEHYEVRELTLALLRRLLAEPGLGELEVGITVQAYLREAAGDLEDLIALSARRSRPLTIRLVKGAYWDTEVVVARAQGWEVPVYTTKAETDASFERCTRLLHASHGRVRAAFGSHNARSLAHAIASARACGIPDSGYEIQTLHGMAEPIEREVRRLGIRHRVYAPVGELVPGMAYLVRRLLENTSDQGFVRRRFAEHVDLEELVAPPAAAPDRDRGPAVAPATDGLRHEPVSEWRRGPVREAFARVVATAPATVEVLAVIGGRQRRTGDSLASVDPAEPSRLVAVSAACGPEEADEAVEAAARAWRTWRRTPVERRAAVLFGVAAWLRARRQELAVLEIFEAGKPWPEADADVCEAIDFCEYYARLALRLDAGAQVESPPGERNQVRYQPRGVGAVIAPWNFPLAIPAGMVSAALVTGNAVLLKPAEQTPALAARLVEAFAAAGLPEGVLSLLPGRGEEVGAHLVSHPGVAFVAFTGSRAVGLEILARAAVHQPGQREVRRVVAEMGGKNALIVDADADLDQAVPLILSSAFGYSGQKCSACSRLIVLDAVRDELLFRLAEAGRHLPIGHPRAPQVLIGPLIDAEAQSRVRDYLSLAAEEGELVLARADLPEAGYFVGPAIVAGLPHDSRVASEEIFGPLLAVLGAGDLDQALAIANRSEYALTAGIVSRSPSHIRRAVAELHAGNIYVNRPITGAVVGRQPFGGLGLSGSGSKAGGSDYLLAFLDAVSISENTIRQGFAPDAGTS